ncbi:MAG: aldehyde dehydrogenase family protein, partial [Candidatus Methylomirabilis sp.]|nr:aldehyde dehydrogenase family protein [Deltaproteobacteria bacterium]
MAQSFATQDPFTGKTLASYAYQPYEAVLAEAAAVRSARSAWAAETPERRAALVRAALGYFRDRAGPIAEEITRQMGKPLAQSRGEIRGLLERAEWLCDAAPSALAPEALPEKRGFHRRIERVPLGTVLVIS